jgi:FMN-dependent oxidoreductase (nitrilotriacetate monooxygenase family)
MQARPFHLAWFMNFSGPRTWSTPFPDADARRWTNGDFYVDMIRAMERGCFDYMMLEDSSMVSDAYAGSSEVDLKYGLYAPKHDPIPLVPVLARATKHIGIVATASTTFYPPFLLARSMATLDHLTEGRVGWNIVTSSEHRAAQNFGMDQIWEHDNRYDRADEFVELVTQLWGSWDQDAVVMDRGTGVYVDHTKVRTIDFEGKYFKSRGPLNTMPPLQGRPVFCQAGGSPRGREFAAHHADTLLASAQGIEAMKEYRNDIRTRMGNYGRSPDTCKVMFIVSPIIGDTHEDALEKKRRMTAQSDAKIEMALGHLSALTENDFSTFDLDQPLEDVETNGHRTTLSNFIKMGAGGKTLREVALGWSSSSLDLVGTPDEVAGQMGEAMEEVGGDGFLISGGLSRRFISEIADGLCPALQRRGLIRDGYEHAHFRDNLLAF